VAVEIKSRAEIEKMRATSQLAASVLDFIAPYVQPGVTTDELDRRCHDYIVERGAIPAPLNYKGFPRSICTSINEVVCHGIPGPRALQAGDIVNVDITTILDGFHGDTSEMFTVGEVRPEALALIEHTRRAMWLGIAQVKPGNRVGDIGHAIQSYAEAHGYGVVDRFCGHGIGRRFHAPPQIFHFGRPGEGERLRPGMTFTIEPMINQGVKGCHVLSDGWTAITDDGLLSAQTEHTVLVTDDGVEVLSVRPGMWRPA
jgi:methionyl aminopeptidase